MTSERTPFRGTYTALVTPFRGGGVDWPTLEKLIDRQLAAGVEGIVACGTTAESPTLAESEHHQIVDAVIKRVNGRCHVLAGTGSNNTEQAVNKARHAEDAGADGALVVTPYYNKPSQEGLFRHYAAIAAAVDLPIVLYNVPARCGVDLLNDTVVRLRSACRTIVAIKDASCDVTRSADLARRSDIDVLSGDDVLTLPMMANGAIGVISVISNLLPEGMKALVDAALAKDFDRALTAHHKTCTVADEIAPLGPNPVPVKTALAMSGLCEEEFRLPLCPFDDARRDKLAEILKRNEVL